jgi:antitoxin (DNA-binding transcriptional repressor) of toxin-antitoxin stability system
LRGVVVAKNGVPHARLVPIVSPGDRRTPANAMLVEYVSPDFDASDPVVERLFAGETE